jgi:hypothetical protein
MHSDEAGVERDHLRKALQETQRAYEKLALISVSLALNVRFTPKSGHHRSANKCLLCAVNGLMHCTFVTAGAIRRRLRNRRSSACIRSR